MLERRDTFPFGQKVYGVVDLKATGPKGKGRFEALVSVFGNVDSYGDRVLKGAFEDTLKAPPEGRGFPAIVWSHAWGIVPIGASMRAEEAFGIDTPKGKLDGLFIDGALLVEEHQTAREVYAAMRQKGGDGLPPLREFSFGYRTRESKVVEEPPADNPDGEPMEIRDLVKLDLFEVGPTLVGANDQTELLAVKARLDLEQGRMSTDLFDELKGWLDERFKFYAGEREAPGEEPPDVGTPVDEEKLAELLTAYPAARSVW